MALSVGSVFPGIHIVLVKKVKENVNCEFPRRAPCKPVTLTEFNDCQTLLRTLYGTVFKFNQYFKSRNWGKINYRDVSK